MLLEVQLTTRQMEYDYTLSLSVLMPSAVLTCFDMRVI